METKTKKIGWDAPEIVSEEDFKQQMKKMREQMKKNGLRVAEIFD